MQGYEPENTFAFSPVSGPRLRKGGVGREQ